VLALGKDGIVRLESVLVEKSLVSTFHHTLVSR
jgi:hypothetical protein